MLYNSPIMIEYHTLERRQKEWTQLQSFVERIEKTGSISCLSAHEIRQFGLFYKRACTDLQELREHNINIDTVNTLNELLRRCFAIIHKKRIPRYLRSLWELYRNQVPQLVRKYFKYISYAATIFTLGAIIGALAVYFDPHADTIFIPYPHNTISPHHRVVQEHTPLSDTSSQMASFGSYLVTHNIQVAVLCFVLGITLGLGTAIILFFNGIPLGALAMSYVSDGEGLFFMAWIFPHGVYELTAIFIAGGAGFLIAKAMVNPRLMTRQQALYTYGRKSLTLFAATLPLLVIAGVVEATISQTHNPIINYELKLTFAGLLFLVMLAYFLLGGREDSVNLSSTSKNDW